MIGKDGEWYTYPRSQILTLSCDCRTRVLRANPYAVGDDYFCSRHHAQAVVSTDGEFKVKCLTHGRVLKSFGLAKLEAQRYADKHQRENPSHRLQVLSGDTVVEVRVVRKGLETLPFGVDEPPF